MSTAAWEAALTAMEDELNAHEAAVRTGNLRVVPEFDPPQGLGALPTSLAERAATLQDRIGLLTTFVQYQLVAAESDLKHLERGSHAGTPGVSLYLDSSV